MFSFVVFVMQDTRYVLIRFVDINLMFLFLCLCPYDRVVNMTVCLSDSQLHLFLQTQLPVGHIQDCVQGHTPYSVTDAILTYASSNRGLAQAQEDDSMKEPSLTVSYESMERYEAGMFNYLCITLTDYRCIQV